MPDASEVFLLYIGHRKAIDEELCVKGRLGMRVLIADNQPKVRLGLRTVLEQEQGMSIVGEASEAKLLLAQVEATCPDLVLLSWELPGLAVADPLSTLRRVCPDLCVIVLSGQPEAESAALAAGADAFVNKTDPPEQLLAVIATRR
jgi:DNA-binding NarL/FixJ family response regulator